MHAQAAYDELIRRTREEAILASCAELLGWDEETYMPPGGVEHRARAMALLAGMQHERATDPRLGELLAVVEHSDLVRDPHEPAAANVREIRRAYNRATRLPRALVEELAATVSFAHLEWVAARQRADFARFRPWHEKIITLKREEAKAIGSTSGAYDALMDEYEPGATTGALVGLFAALRRELLPLVQAIAGSPKQPDAAVLRREYPIDRQQVFAETVALALGFDLSRGRVDIADHPFFASIGPGDCRITARFTSTKLAHGFFTVLHEVGHGLYEQGLDPAHFGTPVGEAVSLGLHESQARLWENFVGRSRAFWTHFFPLARQAFPENLASAGLDEFYAAVNRVEPTFIRAQADEVTYNLHVIIRFELEQALISGELNAADVPAAWAEGYRRYLGITPPDDAAGCLQDGHWAAGLIGYFPTYTLGNVYAAQLFARAEQGLGDLDRQFAGGDFTTLLGWLRERIYHEGSRYPAAHLIERVTGAPPDHRALVQALRRKYGELYEI